MEFLAEEEMSYVPRIVKKAREGAWNEVVSLYKEHPEVQKLKINRSGDTILHIVVLEGKESIVEELVRGLSSDIEALKVQNERGNTPLHLAASLGSARMCHCIASKDSTLIGVRNYAGETPFFLAALRGKKEAFLCLHSICGTDRGYEYCRGNGGETILHSAIRGDYFDLAFQIIVRYDNLVNYVDEQGRSPLHVLASNPSAFRSGSHLGRFKQFIYDHCIFVDELRVETSHDQPDPLEPSEDAENYIASRGRLYGPCIKLISKLMKVFGPAVMWNIKKEKEKHTWSAQVMKELLKREHQHSLPYEDSNPRPFRDVASSCHA